MSCIRFEPWLTKVRLKLLTQVEFSGHLLWMERNPLLKTMQRQQPHIHLHHQLHKTQYPDKEKLSCCWTVSRKLDRFSSLPFGRRAHRMSSVLASLCRFGRVLCFCLKENLLSFAHFWIMYPSSAVVSRWLLLTGKREISFLASVMYVHLCWTSGSRDAPSGPDLVLQIGTSITTSWNHCFSWWVYF